MIGQTFGHYRILEKIAAGGMGVVYRARDEQLERDVALKVLPSGTLSDDSARRHFRREALALAKLNHPNIETVYEFGSQDDLDFLVMEYVSGRTLAERLVRGALPEKEVIALGMQIVAAIEEAHERGIVHRDLKPANVAITARGQAKVLDFGLAKLLRPDDELTTDHLTDSQAAAGTLPYMSPEQLLGEPVDARGDVYSIGVVLYEMVTGRRAFSGDLPSRVIDAILPGPAPPLWRRVLTPTVLGIAALLALAVTLTALNVSGLRDRLMGRARLPQIHSLAVLPLENLSHDPEQEYFADGMTEALITYIAKIRALRVTSRTSVMPYKGTKKPLSQIARELNVDAVVEGSVQRSGDRVRIDAQLIDARKDRNLWTESYQSDLSDVLELQGNVARDIAGDVRVQLTPEERAGLSATRSVKREAYEAYLHGLYSLNKRTPHDLGKAIEYFQKAIDIDPAYALAYAGLADSY